MSTREPASLSGIPGPETVTDEQLPNGMRALVRENHASPSVVVEGVLFGGALLEPPEAPGTAGFATAMLDRGTETRSFETLSDALEAVGAEISFGVGRHTTRFHAMCLAEDLGDVLDMLAEMLRAPTFPDAQVERVRGQIATAMEQRQSNTRHRASVAFRELAYGSDHPYGRNTEGTPESIARISRDDLTSFYRDAATHESSCRASRSRTSCSATRQYPASTRIGCLPAWPTPCSACSG
jgi:zinc protease